MSFLRQLAEVSFEEPSIITLGEQLRHSEGLTTSSHTRTTTTSTNAKKKPSSPSSATAPEQEEALVAEGESSASDNNNDNIILPPCRAPNACFDCCTGILYFLAVLPLVTFIPAIVLQRISTNPTIVAAAGGSNAIVGLSTNGYGFEVSGNWVAALSPIIVLLALATIALIRVCLCAVCCGASGSRSDTDDYIASLDVDVIRVPATVRVFPAFNALREHLRNNNKDDQEEKQENSREESDAAPVAKTTPASSSTTKLSESDVATTAFDALLLDGGNAGTINANKARRKVLASIWILAIVQFIVLCVRLNDSEAGQIQGIQAAVEEVISSSSSSGSNATTEMITAQRIQCGSSVLSSIITANSTTGSGGKTGASLVEEAAVNGLVSIPYPDRSWTATFIPTMLILLLILIDQVVLVGAAHIARIDFTNEETSEDDEKKNDNTTTTDTPTESQKRELKQQQANTNSILLSHSPVLVRLIDVIAVILSFALFLCRLDGTYPYDCNGASALTSSPWLTVLLPIIVSLLLDCVVSLGRGAWLSYSLSGSFSLVASDVTQQPPSQQQEQVPIVVAGDSSPSPPTTTTNTTTTATSDIPFITNITTMIGCCDQARKRMIRRTYYNIVKDTFVCVAALVYVVLLALALDGKISLSSGSTSTITTVSEVVQESLMAAITPLSISASQWHIINIPLYVTIGVGTIALFLRVVLPTSKVGF